MTTMQDKLKSTLTLLPSVTALFRKSKNSVFNFLLSLDRNGKSKRIKVQVPVGNTFDDTNLTQFEIMPYQINI